MFFIVATLGHIPYLSGSFGGGRFVQTVLIEVMSHCYDIFGLHHVSVGCHTTTSNRHSDFIFYISSVQTSPSYASNVLTSSASNVLALQFSHSNFIFYISGIQTPPSYGSDVHTSSASHFLAQQIRRSDFVFCISGVQTLSLYGLDVQTSSASHSLAQ